MSSILDISSMYDGYSSAITPSADKLQSSLGNVNDGTTAEELMDACKGFESYFVQKIIEQAKKTIDTSDDDGEYMQYFSDTLNQSYADLIVDNGGIGLAQQLYDSVKQNYNL